MTNEVSPGLLEFPCRFPIKAMGRHSEEFEQIVCDIIFLHAELSEGEEVKVTPSKAGNYLSITAIIDAQSQQQLDTIYQALTDCEQVLMAL